MICERCNTPSFICRGTTPSHIFETSANLADAKVYVTYQQNGINVIEKTNPDITINETSIAVHLTQEDTLKLKLGTVTAQIRYVTKSGASDVSNEIEFQVRRILKEGLISY